MARLLLVGALLAAALPLFAQTPPPAKTHELLRFHLDETPQQVLKILGRPARIDDSAPGYQSWQYEPSADEMNDDNSPPAWFVCIRASAPAILSITRNFDKPQDVDDLFPAGETTVHHWHSEGAPRFDLRLRRLSEDCLLLAMGTAKPGERTSQLILIRRSALPIFMPWLAEQLR